MKDILAEITRLREVRGWTEYELSQRSGIPQSTISAWTKKHYLPSVMSLDKVCTAFGITLAELFAEDDDKNALSSQQKELLDSWNELSFEQKEAILTLLKLM